MSRLQMLWRDENGFIVSGEMILIATVVILGLIVGLATLRDNIVSELADVGDALSELVQSYSFAGITGTSASISGSVFQDLPDFGETGSHVSDQNAGNFPTCINIQGGIPE